MYWWGWHRAAVTETDRVRAALIKLICRRTNLSREQAYTLCSLAADLRVTQVVNGNKGIHVMLEKKLLS